MPTFLTIFLLNLVTFEVKAEIIPSETRILSVTLFSLRIRDSVT